MTEVAGWESTSCSRLQDLSREAGCPWCKRGCQRNGATRSPGAIEAHREDAGRTSLLLCYRRRRGPGGQVTFPAAAHRSAAEAMPRKEQADQSIDLPALNTMSRTAAARTFPIVSGVHRPGPRKTVGCWRAPGISPSPECSWPVEDGPGAARTVIIPRPEQSRPSQPPCFRPIGRAASQARYDRVEDQQVPLTRRVSLVGHNYATYPSPAQTRQLRYPMDSRVAAGCHARIRAIVRRAATHQLGP